MGELLEIALALTIGASVFTDFVKQALKQVRLSGQPLKPDIVSIAVFLTASLTGIVLAIIFDVNLLASFDKASSGLGEGLAIIASGFVIGRGADWVHVFSDLFYSWRDVRRAQVNATPITATLIGGDGTLVDPTSLG